MAALGVQRQKSVDRERYTPRDIAAYRQPVLKYSIGNTNVSKNTVLKLPSLSNLLKERKGQQNLQVKRSKSVPRCLRRHAATAGTPDVVEQPIPEQKVFGGREFPLVLGPMDTSSPAAKWTGAELAQWVAKNKATLTEQLNTHGALLLRGFSTFTPQDFADVIEAFGWEPFPYVGGNAVRNNVIGDLVFTANEAPPSRTIPFHHEMAQTRPCPSKVMFFCEVPAETGGETPIVLSNQIYEELHARHPHFLRHLEDSGVRYCRVMTQHDRPDSAIGRGWQSTFKVQTKEELETALRLEGADWEWLPGGTLRHISPALPAVELHPATGSKMFFNQIEAAYTGWRDEINHIGKAVTDSHGNPLDKDAMEDIVKISKEKCVAFKWEVGDILVINNDTVLHSRSTFLGTRRILASLAK